MSASAANTPVLIVGGGPVGLALAGDLGWRGIPCTLVEKTDGRIHQPKMDMVGIRSMEFCRRWGIVSSVEEAGYNRDYPQDNAWVTSLVGYELGREAFPAPRATANPPQSPQHRERCPQNFFDPVLRRFAGQFPHVSIAYDKEVVALDEGEDGVRVRVRDTRSGTEESIGASYVVGCDGGASTVRQTIGIAMTGEPVLTYTTNSIFRAAGLEKLHGKKPAYRFIFIGPEGTWATLVAIDGRDKWRFSLVGGTERGAVTPDEMREAIVRAAGKEFDFELLSTVPWIRRQLVADRYGSKRIFIAGDAAHLTSPTGGFGMNTGILDAVNLGWKLEACVRGWAGRHLLDSYEREQRPVAIRNVAEATANLKRMLSPRVEHPPREIFEPGARGDEARKIYGDAYTEMMSREWNTIGIHLGYMYEGSNAIVPDGTPQPPDEVMRYQQTSRPGSRAPHAWLDDGRSTLDLFGKTFVLLRFGNEPPAVDGLSRAAESRGVPLRVVDIDNPTVAKVYERRLVLVRPDGQCAWRGDAQPLDPLQVIDVVRGAVAEAAAGIDLPRTLEVNG